MNNLIITFKEKMLLNIILKLHFKKWEMWIMKND
jgi:hypothetical protein